MQAHISLRSILAIVSLLAVTPVSIAQSSSNKVKAKIKKKKRASKTGTKVNLSLTEIYKSNPDKIATFKGINSNNESYTSKPLYEDVFLQRIGLGLGFQGRPLRRMILKNNTQATGDFQTNSDSNADQIRYAEISNKTEALYVASRTFQLEGSFALGYVDEYRYKFSSSDKTYRKVIKDHVYGNAATALNIRYSKNAKTKIGTGIKVEEFDSAYDYSIEDGQQDDNLKSYSTIDNSFKLNKVVSVNIPIQYSKTWYKNKVATDELGAGFSSGYRRIETLEEYGVGLGLEIALSDQVSLSLSDRLSWQEDLSAGGQDYSLDELGASLTWKNEGTSLSFGYSQERVDYKNSLLDTSNLQGDRYQEITHVYSISLGISKPFNLPADLKISASKELHRDNYDSGRYDLDAAQVGLSFPL